MRPGHQPQTSSTGSPATWRSGRPPGTLEAELQFRRLSGYRDLAKLAIAIERDLSSSIDISIATEEAGALAHA